MLPADELFCIAVDERSHQLRLTDKVAGIGLAAALLAELVLWGRIDVDATHLRVRPGSNPGDALGYLILEEIDAESTVSEVRPWLEFLATDAVDRVGRRVERRRLFRREESRRLGRTRTTYAPVDNNAVIWRAVRLAQILTTDRPGERLHPADVVSGGLVAATGLSRVVLWLPEHRDVGDKRIVDMVNELSDPLRNLIRHAEAAVGDAILAPH